MAVVGTPEGREALQRWKARQAGESTALEDSFDISNQVEMHISKNPIHVWRDFPLALVADEYASSADTMVENDTLLAEFVSTAINLSQDIPRRRSPSSAADTSELTFDKLSRSGMRKSFGASERYATSVLLVLCTAYSFQSQRFRYKDVTTHYRNLGLVCAIKQTRRMITSENSQGRATRQINFEHFTSESGRSDDKSRYLFLVFARVNFRSSID